jgi:hypothetical protein
MKAAQESSVGVVSFIAHFEKASIMLPGTRPMLSFMFHLGSTAALTRRWDHCIFLFCL